MSLRAEMVAVGSELLRPGKSDANGLWLSDRLLELGIPTLARTTVADDEAALTEVFRVALGRAQVVISTGGLGPTDDDLTREAAAAALGRPLARSAALVEELRQRFARYGRPMAEVNLQQADVIEGATVLPNRRGSAPGQLVEADARLLVLLPGPPGEMRGMWDDHLAARLGALAGGRVVRRRVLALAAASESDVEQVAAPIYTRFENPQTTILGAAGHVELHLVAEAATAAEADARIEELAALLRTALAGRIYSEDGRELPLVVGDLLRSRGLRLAVAESCTGGLLAARLTDVAGSSDYFERGFVAYANRAKVELLGVDPTLVDRHGAVSEEVARAMAAGARRAAGVDVGVGVTGIAGPGGGTLDKPVGLVFVALCGAAGDVVRRIQVPGERKRVRDAAVHVALELLRRGLLGLSPP